MPRRRVLAKPSPADLAVRANYPKVTIVPPIAELLSDLQTVAGAEMTRMKRMQAEFPDEPLDARSLDALASAVKRSYDLSKSIEDDMELGDVPESELERRLLGDGSK